MPVIEVQDGAHKAKILVSANDAQKLHRGDRLFIPMCVGGDPLTSGLQYRFVHVEEILW